jgi:hypothetical protein
MSFREDPVLASDIGVTAAGAAGGAVVDAPTGATSVRARVQSRSTIIRFMKFSSSRTLPGHA